MKQIPYTGPINIRNHWRGKVTRVTWSLGFVYDVLGNIITVSLKLCDNITAN